MPQLTPEDRQRIYAEEKARFDAQEKLKAEKGVKDFGIGCLVLIILGILGYVWFSSRSVQLEQARPERGAIVTTKAGYPPLCMDSKEGLDEASEWFGKDIEEVARAIVKYGGEIVQPGTSVKLLDPGILRAKVRVLSSGRECWVVRELVQ